MYNLLASPYAALAPARSLDFAALTPRSPISIALRPALLAFSAKFKPFSKFVVIAPIPGNDLLASKTAPAAPPVASLIAPPTLRMERAVSPTLRSADLPVVDKKRPTFPAALRPSAWY